MMANNRIHLGNIDANLATADWLKDADDLAASGVDVATFLKANPDLPIAHRKRSVSKRFGDPGSTQEREGNGEFGPGSGARLRDAPADSHDAEELAMRSQPIPSGTHVTDTLAARYAADADFTADSSGTHEGDDLLEGFPTPEEAAAQADAIIAARAAKGFGDPGSTQERLPNGTFGPGDMDARATAAGLTGTHDIQDHTPSFISPSGRMYMSNAAWQHADLAQRMGYEYSSELEDNGAVRIRASGTEVDASITQPMTDAQINTLRSGVMNYTPEEGTAAPGTPITFYMEAATGSYPSFIGNTDNPASISSAITSANTALGRTTKGFGDPGSTQDRQPNGTFGPGSGMTNDEMRQHITGDHNFDIVRGRGQRATMDRTHDWLHTTSGLPTDHTHDATKGFGDPGSTQQQDAHGRFTVGSGAPRDAANLKYPELRMSDMKAGATNSPLMTRQEFQASAARGEDIVNSAIANGSPHADMMTPANVQAVVDASKQEWGGVTIDAHGGGIVAAHGDDPLSVSMRDAGQGSVTIPITSDPAALTTAMQQAQSQFADQLSAQGAALGMFRDEKAGTVQFDPVLVVQGVSTARDVGAYTGATGGAYRFSDGNGYWPGHVA